MTSFIGRNLPNNRSTEVRAVRQLTELFDTTRTSFVLSMNACSAADTSFTRKVALTQRLTGRFVVIRRDFGLSLLVLFAFIAAALAQEVIVVESSHQLPPFTVKTAAKSQAPIGMQRSSVQPTSVTWEKDLIAGRKAMGKSKRPMLLYLTAPTCRYCELMKQDTFQQQWIISEINKKYIPVTLNGREHKSIADKLHVRMFPATVVVHPSGKVVDKVEGYKTPSEFVTYLATAQAKLKFETEQIAKRQKSEKKTQSVR